MWRPVRRFIRGPFPLPVRHRQYPFAFGPPYPKFVPRPNGFGGLQVRSVREERRERELYETVPMYPDAGWEKYESYITGMYDSFHADAQRLYDETSFKPVVDTSHAQAICQRVEVAFTEACDRDEAHYCDSNELTELAEAYEGYAHYIKRLAHAFVYGGMVPVWPAEKFEAALTRVIEQLLEHERQDPNSDAWWWREDAEFLLQLAKVLRDATSEVQAEDHDAPPAE